MRHRTDQPQSGHTANDPGTRGEPAISVVILYYEQARYLSNLLQALAAQARDIHEVILVDDHSEREPAVDAVDDSETGINQFIRNAANAGVVSSMNAGLKEVSGSHVHFLAADDLVEPGFYALARETLARHPGTGIFSTPSRTLDANGEVGGVLAQPEPASAHLDGAAVVRSLYRTGSWFTGNATVFDVVHLRAAGGFEPDLEGFSDAFACYAIAARHGACFQAKPLALKRTPYAGQGARMYIDAERSRALLARITVRLENLQPASFDQRFIDRFRRRWRYTTRTIGMVSEAADHRVPLPRRMAHTLIKAWFFVLYRYDEIPAYLVRFPGGGARSD